MEITLQQRQLGVDHHPIDLQNRWHNFWQNQASMQAYGLIHHALARILLDKWYTMDCTDKTLQII